MAVNQRRMGLCCLGVLERGQLRLEAPSFRMRPLQRSSALRLPLAHCLPLICQRGALRLQLPFQFPDAALLRLPDMQLLCR